MKSKTLLLLLAALVPPAYSQTIRNESAEAHPFLRLAGNEMIAYRAAAREFFKTNDTFEWDKLERDYDIVIGKEGALYSITFLKRPTVVAGASNLEIIKAERRKRGVTCLVDPKDLKFIRMYKNK